MSKNILLAVDAASNDPVRHVVAAAEMTRELHGIGELVIWGCMSSCVIGCPA